MMVDDSVWVAALGLVGVLVSQWVIFAEGRRRSQRTDATATRTEKALKQVSVNADTAATEAASAAERIVPVSNGFAEEMRAGLARIERNQMAHAEELREELREVRHELDRHIGDHASADVRRRGTDEG